MALDDLTWLGLDWDEGPDRRRAFLDSLCPVAPDACVSRVRSRPIEGRRTGLSVHLHAGRRRASRLGTPRRGRGAPYPGPARAGPRDAGALGDRPFAWRFRVPPGAVGWTDLFRGGIRGPSSIGGDFIVARQGGAVVSTRRGRRRRLDGRQPGHPRRDLIPSTPRQILLYRDSVAGPTSATSRSCRPRRPSAGEAGRVDQAGDAPRGRGRPARLVGWLAGSLGLTDRVEPTSPKDWVPSYLARVPEALRCAGQKT